MGNCSTISRQFSTMPGYPECPLPSRLGPTTIMCTCLALLTVTREDVKVRGDRGVVACRACDAVHDFCAARFVVDDPFDGIELDMWAGGEDPRPEDEPGYFVVTDVLRRAA